MLYRPGTAFDWQFVDFSQVGIWSIGNLFVENLQKGEYALAVCDDTFVDVKKNQSKKNSGLLIYPNPSNNSLYIESKQSGTVCIYNTDGRMIETIVIPEDGLYQVHHKNNLAEGTYLTRFQSADGTISNEGKIVIIQK
jgi:hypothetical protein